MQDLSPGLKKRQISSPIVLLTMARGQISPRRSHARIRKIHPEAPLDSIKSTICRECLRIETRETLQLVIKAGKEACRAIDQVYFVRYLSRRITG